MICTKCNTDDGFEAPSLIGFTADYVEAICAGWMCPSCLDRYEAQQRQEAIAHMATDSGEVK